MYKANIIASNPFNKEAYDAAKYNEKMRQVRLFDISIILFERLKLSNMQVKNQ